MSGDPKQKSSPAIDTGHDIAEFFPVLAHEVYRLSEILNINLSSLSDKCTDLDSPVTPASLARARSAAARLFYLSEIALMASKSLGQTFSPKTMHFNIKKSVEEVIAELQIAYPDSVERISFQASLDLNVKADPVLIEFALSNILENAIKYGAGNIDLYIEEGADPLVFKSPYTMIKVENDAPSEHLPDPNKSVSSPPRISWGLGLDLIKQIANAHDGKFLFKMDEVSVKGDSLSCRRVSSMIYLPRA